MQQTPHWWCLSHVQLLQPMDGSLPGSSVHGILQVKILEWVAISFSRGSSRPTNQTQVSCIAGRLFTDWAMGEAPSKAFIAAAKSLQSCLTLCDPIEGSLPGSSVPGILQARTLEWVAISFSNASKWKMKVKSLSRIQLLATPWTAAYQTPPSMGFSRQEHWSGVPLPSLKALISCFQYITPTFLHSNLMNDIVHSILHVRNKGSEILTSSSGWAENPSNSNAQAAFLGHVPFVESFFFSFGKKIYLEQKREKVSQFIMNLEGGQSCHSPKLKRIKKCSNKLLLVKYIREIIQATVDDFV